MKVKELVTKEIKFDKLSITWKGADNHDDVTRIFCKSI